MVMSFFMVERLIRSGCKRIVYISGPERIRNGVERRRGYREALEKYNIAYDPALVLPSALSADEGSKVMKRFIEQGTAFDAVFGFTETALLGAKSVIQKRGLRIPDDVRICCMSGTTLCTFVHPTITAVEQPVEQMATETCRLIMAHVADDAKATEDVVLRGEIIDRESTAG